MVKKQLIRPIVLLPWLVLDGVIEIGQVRFSKLSEVGPPLTTRERRRLQAFSESFFELIRGTGAGKLITLDPVVGIAQQRRPGNEAKLRASRVRLDYASFVLGACICSPQSEWPAEAVQPYRIDLDEHLPETSFVYPYANGELVISTPDTFMMTKPPWVPSSSTAHVDCKAEVLGRLIDRAVRDPKGRAAKTVSSMEWYVRGRTFALNTSPLPNLVALGTAMEMLLNIPELGPMTTSLPPAGVPNAVNLGKPRRKTKTELFVEAVGETTGSTVLAKLTSEFYNARSRLTHDGSFDAYISEEEHLTWLRFGQELYELSLFDIVERVHKLRWGQTAGITVWDKGKRVARVERLLEPNLNRLKDLTAVSAPKVFTTPERTETFLNLLQGMGTNPTDVPNDQLLLVSTWRHACRAIKDALYAGSKGQPRGVHDDMRALADVILSRANEEPPRSRDICDMLEEDLDEGGMCQPHPGAHVPILGSLSLFQLLGESYLGTLGDMVDAVISRSSP